MLSGLTRILSRIKWWLTKSEDVRATCKHFCLNCAFYELCKKDQSGEYNEDDYTWHADVDYEKI